MRRIDPYLAALFGCVALASVLPARGVFATALGYLTSAAVALLFLLYGARLSPQDAWEGAKNVKLHALVLAFTYVLFPLLGLLLAPLVPSVLSPEQYVGFVFLCVLPSTVQSSIAFTSIARGNVAAALCAASISNLLGVLITPLFVGLLLSKQGGALPGGAIQKLFLSLMLPFFVGQLLRPRISGWVAKHKQLLGYVDRSSILLVVYSAFSAGVVSGMWSSVSWSALAIITLLCSALLALVLAISTFASRLLAFSKADEIAIVMCGSKKSLVSGLPMATVLFPAATVGMTVLPIMLFHQIQLLVCAFLARRYGARADA
jgi:solute carrier family 10 (sodium/bile acid cotransporter), member 7